MTDARAAALAWLESDPDPETRAETKALLAADDREGLDDRFGSRLTFGTAGLRGALGAGPNRMNRLVITQTTAGLARFLLGRETAPTAVVGYDGRRNSARFARDAVQVLTAAGVDAVLLPAALPTPVLAFAVRHLGASAGVMITASHNPAPDNGYKLYLGGADAGSQIVPPADSAVLAAIDAVVAEGGLPPHADEDGVRIAPQSVVDAYVAATAAVGAGAPEAPRWVYTPMHGVGLETITRVVADAGQPQPVVVPEQADPNPDFPTAPFPNPEEPGTLDLAFALASAEGAELVLANDPDADRLAVAIPDPSESAGWRRLTGNETGLLLGWELASAEGAAGGVLAASVVSTPGLARIAGHFGLDHAETLTGFKWISRVPSLRFGFEEALGYLVDAEVVRDKDGISALVAVLALAGRLRAAGRTIADRLAEIEHAIGRYDSRQVSVRVHHLSRIDELMASLRADPPSAFGPLPVRGIDDLLVPTDALPPTDGLRFRLDGARVVVRPSGTEPKLKVYLDAWSDAPDSAARHAATTSTLDALEQAVAGLLI